jgi:hypothetical protein
VAIPSTVSGSGAGLGALDAGGVAVDASPLPPHAVSRSAAAAKPTMRRRLRVDVPKINTSYSQDEWHATLPMCIARFCTYRAKGRASARLRVPKSSLRSGSIDLRSMHAPCAKSVSCARHTGKSLASPSWRTFSTEDVLPTPEQVHEESHRACAAYSLRLCLCLFAHAGCWLSAGEPSHRWRSNAHFAAAGGSAKRVFWPQPIAQTSARHDKDFPAMHDLVRIARVAGQRAFEPRACRVSSMLAPTCSEVQ